MVAGSMSLEALEHRCLMSAAATSPEVVPVEATAAHVVAKQRRRRPPKRNAAVKLVVKDASVNEGDPGQVRQASFQVVRKGSLAGNVKVRFTVSKLFADGVRNATNDVDFNAKAATLKFGPGDKVKTVPVGIIGDNIDEDDEQFSITLSRARGAVIRRAVGLGTIVDNDAGKTVDVRISDDNFTPDESATYPPTVLPVRLTYTNTGNADSGITAVQFQLLVFNGGNLDGTAELGPFILVPNVPAGGSINVDYVLDFNRAFIFNDRWDVYAKVLLEDDNPVNNLRRLGDIQITIPV